MRVIIFSYKYISMLTGKSLVINIPICENIFKIRFLDYSNGMKWINYTDYKIQSHAILLYFK